MFGCGGASVAPVTPAPTASYQVVAISDLHFNPLYDPSLFTRLVAADPSDWDAIFQSSSVVLPSVGGTDTNYLLLMLTLASIKQNMKNSPVVLFTGDVLGHNIPANYCKIYAPLHQLTTAQCAATQGAAIQQFITNTFTFVAMHIGKFTGTAPVIYVPGNIDAFAGGFGPDTNFLTKTSATVYSQLLKSGFDPNTFLNTFAADGYYSVAPLGSKLQVIGLNSNLWIVGAPASTAASTELTWLDTQLAAAQAAGQKVWILMHVPPGANSQLIAQMAAVPEQVPSAMEENPASMMWQSALQDTFLRTLAKYPGLVTMMLAGHTHMDEFRILPTGDVLEQLPGISPCFGNNPAFKVLTITQDTFTPTDYQSLDYNLAAMPAQFGTLYQFSTTYSAQTTWRTRSRNCIRSLPPARANKVCMHCSTARAVPA